MKRKILIVDDSKFARTMLKAPLERMGHHVITLDGPHSAVDELSNPEFVVDVIITDLKMPTLMDGLGFLKVLSLSNKGTPIIVYSSDPHAEELVGDMGFESIVFLKKPVSPTTLQKNFQQFFPKDD